jgi:hypothetical protein
VGWGRNQSSTPSNYILNFTTGLKFELASGAVFQSWESYNAYTFDPAKPVPSGQGSLAQWIARGGTAGVGHVEEPYASSANVANSDVMFQMMLDGYTWGEAAWAATTQLSYVNTVVGDPLMTWKQLIPGDVDRNGVVDLTDLNLTLPSLSRFGATVKPGGSLWTQGDMNNDGIVDLSDFFIVWRRLGEKAPWWTDAPTSSLAFVAPDAAILTSTTVAPIPEPSSLCLALSGIVAFAMRRRRHCRA